MSVSCNQFCGNLLTYGKVGHDFSEGVAAYAARDLEVGVILDGEDPVPFGVDISSDERDGARDGGGDEGKEEGGLEKHCEVGCLIG